MNRNFLSAIQKSFAKYLSTGARSNEKLKIIHGRISADLLSLLGDGFSVKSLGFANGKEESIQGRYTDKKVDIAIYRGKEIIGGIGVKFVMSNYFQNSNNYFENMLGETANIRSARKAYFQIFIIPYEVPYYQKNGDISKVEHLTENNIKKYLSLSKDSPKEFLHTPDKTLLVVISLPCLDITKVKTAGEYKIVYQNAKVNYSQNVKNDFSAGVIYNDYENFLNKVAHYIKSL